MSLHQVPDPRAGEGVPLQHVPHERPQERGGEGSEPHGAAGEDLVPEQENEDEETEQGPAERLALHTHVYAHRATYTHAYIPVHTYMHTFMHADKHAYNTYIHTVIHTFMHTCIHTYITYIHT